MQKYGRLTATMVKEPAITKTLFGFLEEAEIVALLMSSKLLRSKHIDLLNSMLALKIEKRLAKINENKKKGNYTKVLISKNGNAIRDIFCRPQVVQSTVPQTVLGTLPSKFADTNLYCTFLFEKVKRYLFVPRCWVDENLNLFHNETSDNKPEMHKLIERINLETAHVNDSKTAFFLKHKKLQESLQKETQTVKLNAFDQLNNFFKVKKFGIFLFQGGDFTFALYEDFKELTHGSEHKYVIRAKGGGKQSTKDKTKSIKSVGSQIRRENEKILLENIEELIKQKSADIASCGVVFVYAPGLNMNTMVKFFENAGVDKSLIRSIGFNSGKAKYMELQKIFKRLLSFYVV